MTSSPHSVEDYLPSICRPTAWETASRNRQLVDDPYDGIIPSNSSLGWRRDEVPNHTHSRRQFIEAQEQLKMYKEELTKKTRLIQELTSLETPRPPAFDTTRIDQLLDASNAEALSLARSQVSALQVKVDGFQSQIRELNRQLESRDELISELRALGETSKETTSRQSAVILSLRQRVVDCDTHHGGLETVASRSELALATLQRECHSSQEQVLRLESELRSLSEANASLKHHRAEAELRWNELTKKLKDVLELSDVTAESEEHIFTKVEMLVRTQSTHHSKIESFERMSEVVQQEMKANRETITRLSSEKEQLEAYMTRHTDEISRLRRELDTSETQRRQLQLDVGQLRARVDEVIRERDSFQSRVEEMHRESSTQEELRQRDHSRHSSVISHMISVLRTVEGLDSISEATIVDHLKHVVHSYRDKHARVSLLERQLAELTADLESHRAELTKIGSSSDRFAGIEQRLMRAEQELAAGDVLRDNLRADREKILKFLENLSKVLVINEMAVDVGLDGLTNAILARSEQLIKNETTEITDRKSHIFSLQRKLKIMKDQLDSKDVHMDLLRKKTVSLEERLSNKSELEREKDEESVRSRKLMKLAEKYKRELNEAHVELRDMRARLLTTSELQLKDTHSKHEIERLEAEVRRLEELNQGYSVSFSELKQSFSTTTKKQDKKREETSTTISALTSELRTTKQALNDVTAREQQLVELRCVVARMLGMAIDTLAVPDYEIITRLEQLILANQTNAATAFALDSAIADLGDGFRIGYRGRMVPVVGGPVAPLVSHHQQHVTRRATSSAIAAHRLRKESEIEAGAF